MTFWEAHAIAVAGSRVRRKVWAYWLRYSAFVWYIETTSGLSIVKASDVTATDYLALDWTTDEISTEDPCARPPAAKPIFVPPAVWIEASWSDGVLTIKGGIGEGSSGFYRLAFEVDGSTVGNEIAAGTQAFTLTVSQPWAASFWVRLRVESVLPLPAWIGTAERIVRPTFSAFDFAVIRYSWDAAGGTDLDTRTALVEVDPTVNGLDVGWSRANTVSGLSGDYLQWGGDNTSPTGTEAVLIDFLKLAADFPAAVYIKVRLRANWYGARGTGDIAVQFATYVGGSMSQVGTNFENTGGAEATVITVPGNITSNSKSNVDGEYFRTLVYHVPSRTASLTI